MAINKNIVFTLITIGIGAAMVEVGLRAIHFSMNHDGWAVQKALAPFIQKTLKLDLPDHILAELIKVGAVIDNSNNPTGAKKNDTIVVMPDPELGYVLRAGTSIDGYMLHSTVRPNWDLPVLYVKSGVVFSTETAAWLARNSYINYRYTITPQGYRITLPQVSDRPKVLVVGDSVGFGVGVSDEYTSASYLQKIVENQYAIENRSVGGYDGDQAYLTADKAIQKSPYAGIVYVACENDFNSAEDVDRVLGKFAKLKDKVNGNLIVAFTTYLEYNNSPYVTVRSAAYSQKTTTVMQRMEAETARLGMKWLNWDSLARQQIKVDATPYGIFSLYVDDAHFSPKGNQLLAKNLANLLQDATRK